MTIIETFWKRKCVDFDSYFNESTDFKCSFDNYRIRIKSIEFIGLVDTTEIEEKKNPQIIRLAGDICTRVF